LLFKPSIGNRSHPKKQGVSLDVARCEKKKDGIMTALLEHRWDHDEVFRHILLRVAALDIFLGPVLGRFSTQRHHGNSWNLSPAKHNKPTFFFYAEKRLKKK